MAVFTDTNTASDTWVSLHAALSITTGTDITLQNLGNTSLCMVVDIAVPDPVLPDADTFGRFIPRGSTDPITVTVGGVSTIAVQS